MSQRNPTVPCDILLSVTTTTQTADVLVIGAGIVGASVAYHAVRAGLRVAVVDRGGPAAGTSSACEGNILVSDKEPGAELELAMLSRRLWDRIADDLGPQAFEFDAKEGVVVATSEAAAGALRAFAAKQRAAGIEVADVDPAGLRELEPNLSRDVAGGAHYPQDAQVQPMLATAHLLARARGLGASVHLGTTVTGFTKTSDGRVTGVATASPTLPTLSARWVVNAAGTWAGEVAALADAPIPILPRRGFLLVTEPLPKAIVHKVYTADYVANVASSDADLQTSVVVEGTPSGTVLIGASRERVGFERTFSAAVIRRLAAQVVELFPFLADVSLMRTYLGFRPYCPDHLPVIGEDPRASGLIHAAGHEGAGIGLSAATGHLIAQLAAGIPTDLDLGPFRPDRFDVVSA